MDNFQKRAILNIKREKADKQQSLFSVMKSEIFLHATWPIPLRKNEAVFVIWYFTDYLVVS